MGDRRDVPTWVAMELTRHGEALMDAGDLESQLRRDLDIHDWPEFEVFVPSVVYRQGPKIITMHLMEGYVFVTAGLDEVRYFALERLNYIEQVMSTPSGRMRTLATVSDAHVRAMQEQLRDMVAQEIELGAHVLVLDGPYRHLEGEVVGLHEDSAFVRIVLRSLQIIATVPRVFLDPDADGFGV